MTADPGGDLLTVAPDRHGGRLVFYHRAADADYWDELWDSLPVDYRRARTGHLPRHLRRAVRRHLRPGDRVLEAGCGPGEFSVAMAARGFVAEAVDWAPRTVERLRAAAPELRVWRGDVRQLDVPDGHYDAVYSPGVCEHFEPGPEPVLRETFRVLRPGGVALVSTPCFNPMLRMLGRASRLRPPRSGRTAGAPARLLTPGDGAPVIPGQPGGAEPVFYQYAFTPQGLAAVLREIGFDQVRARPYGALATPLAFTGPGRALAARVPRSRLRPLEAGLDVVGTARFLGQACLWVARRPPAPAPAAVPPPRVPPSAHVPVTGKELPR